MTRRGFEAVDFFQAEVLSSLVKQRARSPKKETYEVCHEEIDDEFDTLWFAVPSLDN